MNKLTNQDLDILQELLEDRIKQIDSNTEISQNPQVYVDLIKKLNSMYFA